MDQDGQSISYCVVRTHNQNEIVNVVLGFEHEELGLIYYTTNDNDPKLMTEFYIHVESMCNNFYLDEDSFHLDSFGCPVFVLVS